MNRNLQPKIIDNKYEPGEIYCHNFLLFVALMRAHPKISWRANNHADGTMYKKWFIAGMELPTGQISYHLPEHYWEMLDNSGIKTSNNAPYNDGHTSRDILERLTQWIQDSSIADYTRGKNDK